MAGILRGSADAGKNKILIIFENIYKTNGNFTCWNMAWFGSLTPQMWQGTGLPTTGPLTWIRSGLAEAGAWWGGAGRSWDKLMTPGGGAGGDLDLF